jgi:hypothetical protein
MDEAWYSVDENGTLSLIVDNMIWYMYEDGTIVWYDEHTNVWHEIDIARVIYSTEAMMMLTNLGHHYHS